MNDNWSTELSRKSSELVNKFYMVQQALAKELSQAKPLGICKTCISTNPVLSLDAQDLTSKSGRNGTGLNTLGNDVLKEMS